MSIELLAAYQNEAGVVVIPRSVIEDTVLYRVVGNPDRQSCHATELEFLEEYSLVEDDRTRILREVYEAQALADLA